MQKHIKHIKAKQKEGLSRQHNIRLSQKTSDNRDTIKT